MIKIPLRKADAIRIPLNNLDQNSCQHFCLKSILLLLMMLQLNECETAPYFIQFSQNLTCDFCWFLCFPLNLPELNLELFWASEQNNFRHGLGENTEINKQSHVKFWLNWKKYGAVPLLYPQVLSYKTWLVKFQP